MFAKPWVVLTTSVLIQTAGINPLLPHQGKLGWLTAVTGFRLYVPNFG